MAVKLGEMLVRAGLISQEQLDEALVSQKSNGEKIGYNLEVTLGLLSQNWTERQEHLLDGFPDPIRRGMLANRDAATFLFMDEEAWRITYRRLLESFVPGDADWDELLFRLWITRVINYTATRALRGYEHAQSYLASVVDGYVHAAQSGP